MPEGGPLGSNNVISVGSTGFERLRAIEAGIAAGEAMLVIMCGGAEEAGVEDA